MNLSCPVNDGSNRTAYKTCLKFWIETQKSRLAKQGVVANIAEGQSKGLTSKEQKKLILMPQQISKLKKPKYNKNTILIRILSCLYIWKQHSITYLKNEIVRFP